MAYDAVIVGAGPNGLAAAITLAQARKKVLVLEAQETIGGGARTMELTLPGFLHDHCSTSHAFGPLSPFLKELPLARYGLTWIEPPSPLAHPLDDGSAAILERSLDATIASLGVDGEAYRRLVAPLLSRADALFQEVLVPLHVPRSPLLFLRFGLQAMRSVVSLARRRFRGPHARSLLAGLAAHSFEPLERRFTASVALVLGLSGHTGGWPMPQGGSQRLIDALAQYLTDLGGEIRTSVPVRSLRDVPASRAVLFSVTPRQLLSIAGDALPTDYRRRLARFRYGPGVFKVDWALDGPIPWRADGCARASTVHLGGTLEEIAASERMVSQGEHPERPFVILTQQSLFDPTRAPPGKQTAWGYCHVPRGSMVDMADAIERQIERFAPGFRRLILKRHVTNTRDLEAANENNIGGDISGGAMDARQLFVRPTLFHPYATPNERLFLCSSSTPPGGGVHGMCGYNAARLALRTTLRD